MKIKNILYILCFSMLFWACQSADKKQEENIKLEEKNDHEGHDHEGDDHTGHDHAEKAEAHEHGDDCDHDHVSEDHASEDHADHDHDADDHAGHDHAKKDAGTHDEDEIVFTKEQAKLVGLEHEVIKAGDFNQVIRTSGQILSAQGDETTVSATVSGIVSFNKASLNEGTAVRAGEALLSISAKNMAEGDLAAKAKNQYNNTKIEFERAQSLIDDKLISATEYNEAKLNYENAKASYGSFARQQTAKGSAMSSNIAGYVKSKLVAEGQYVEVGQALLVVTNNKKLQLRADVSERYYNYLSAITSANFKTPYQDVVYRLADLNGKVTSYGKSMANDAFYLPVNFEFNNVGQIIPGAFVDVYLLADKRQNVITVPVAALIEDQGVYFVFKRLGKNAEAYKKEEVRLGATDGSRVEILAGVNREDIIVSKAAIHVKLASASGAIPHGHEH